jgi:desulfoferrodoxin (superoxide reductase-like protein)
MPTISMFYGLMISLFYEDNDRPHLPHIHVRYQGERASIAIETGDLLAGKLPPKQIKLVQAWIELHQDELLANWQLVNEGEEPYKIAPLQ